VQDTAQEASDLCSFCNGQKQA